MPKHSSTYWDLRRDRQYRKKRHVERLKRGDHGGLARGDYHYGLGSTLYKHSKQTNL